MSSCHVFTKNDIHKIDTTMDSIMNKLERDGFMDGFIDKNVGGRKGKRNTIRLKRGGGNNKILFIFFLVVVFYKIYQIKQSPSNIVVECLDNTLKISSRGKEKYALLTALVRNASYLFILVNYLFHDGNKAEAHEVIDAIINDTNEDNNDNEIPANIYDIPAPRNKSYVSKNQSQIDDIPPESDEIPFTHEHTPVRSKDRNKSFVMPEPRSRFQNVSHGVWKKGGKTRRKCKKRLSRKRTI